MTALVAAPVAAAPSAEGRVLPTFAIPPATVLTVPQIAAAAVTVPLPSSPPPSAGSELDALASRPHPGTPSPTLAPPKLVEGPPPSLVWVAPAPDEPTYEPTDEPTDEPTENSIPEVALFAIELPGISGSALPFDEALVVERIPEDAVECRDRARLLPLDDRNQIAQMTTAVFECVALVAGLGERPATSTGWWDGAELWGFKNLADQVAAEAVVVAWCESKAFDSWALTHNNPWGYGGLFQMGATEMRRFGLAGSSKFDPVDNAYGAASYFIYMYSRGGGFGGWGPWAVVNTGFNDAVNDQVRVPVLPRFLSTDPSYRGRSGPELPAWAIDPTAYEVPGFGGCPFTGGSWPQAVAIEG